MTIKELIDAHDHIVSITRSAYNESTADWTDVKDLSIADMEAIGLSTAKATIYKNDFDLFSPAYTALKNANDGMSPTE